MFTFNSVSDDEDGIDNRCYENKEPDQPESQWLGGVSNLSEPVDAAGRAELKESSFNQF